MTEAKHTSSPGRAIPLGEIVGTHGVRGLLRFHPYDPSSDDPTAPRAVQLTPRTPAGASSAPVTRQLLSSRPHGRVRLLQFADVDSIEEAEPLVGTVLAVDEQELTPPAPGQYFVYQLEGLDVFTVAGERLGAIVRVFPTGSNEVLVVQNGEREHLIPMIADVVQSVDMASRRVVIEPIAGLLE